MQKIVNKIVIKYSYIENINNTSWFIIIDLYQLSIRHVLKKLTSHTIISQRPIDIIILVLKLTVRAVLFLYDLKGYFI
jgi:hypothetical protein